MERMKVRFGFDFGEAECVKRLEEYKKEFIDEGWVYKEDEKTHSFYSSDGKWCKGWWKESGKYFLISEKWMANLRKTLEVSDD